MCPEKFRGRLERSVLGMTLNSAPVSSRNSYGLPSIFMATRGDRWHVSLDEGKRKILGSSSVSVVGLIQSKDLQEEMLLLKDLTLCQ